MSKEDDIRIIEVRNCKASNHRELKCHYAGGFTCYHPKSINLQIPNKGVHKDCPLPRKATSPEIRQEMDSDMQESGMAQGEIEGCLNHWNSKYIITRKEDK
jgi:hypothetical protein